MPNHIHLIAVPETEQALRRAIGEAHRRYTRRINFREKWRGYLWQGRFASFVMDEPYLAVAARYVELNPVRANLVADAADWPWSSARAHLLARDDCLVQVTPLLTMIHDWRAFLDSALPEEQLIQIRSHGRTGRPLGDASFLERLEGLVGRVLHPRKPGRKPRFAK
ncbi:MAG: transposase [Planctomycetes bacterium]|nr:transposase [Planctomycetota bacterium]